MKKGDVVRVNSGALKDALAVIVRRSKSTGTLTVKVIRNYGALCVNDEVHVKPYECRIAMDVRP